MHIGKPKPCARSEQVLPNELPLVDVAVLTRRSREAVMALIYKGVLEARRDTRTRRWYITADSVSQVLAADRADEERQKRARHLESHNPDAAPAA